MAPGPGARSYRYLFIGLAVSLLAHACVLALRFEPPAPASRPAAASLEVVLVNAHTDSAPLQPAALAQADLDGGGDSEEPVLARSPLPPSADAQSWLPATADKPAPLPALEARQRELMAQLEARYAVYTETLSTAGAPALAAEGVRDQLDQAQAQLAQQFAAISQRIEDYNRRPRRHYFAPSTSAVPYAEYVEAWRTRIETVGNRDYPAAARGKVYGSLQMTVYVRADGSVEDVAFDQPSPHAILNTAARDIVAKAAPFAPFPDIIKRDSDVIAITRTWHFQNDAVSTEIP